MSALSCSRFVIGLGLVLPLVVGCGGGGELSTAKAGGKVTFNGQPVADAVVVFSPASGATSGGAATDAAPTKTATGQTDAQGQFVLSTYVPGDGAVVGKYQVSVSSDDTAKPLPGKSPESLIVEVQAGTDNNFDIELTP